jgi:hypothetical protein
MTVLVPLSRAQMAMETRTVATSSRLLYRSRTESVAVVRARIAVRTDPMLLFVCRGISLYLQGIPRLFPRRAAARFGT